MHKVTLLRHGQSDGNARGLIQGQTDLPLNEIGIQQARSIAQTWYETGRHFDLVIASPLQRARATAEIIAEKLHSPIEFTPEIIERGFGDIEGRAFEEILKEVPPTDFNHPYLRPGIGGESIVDLFARASLALLEILDRPAGSYLIVSHGAFLNMMMYCILGVSPHNSPQSPRFVFSNTGYIDLTYTPDNRQWRVYHFWSCDEKF